MFHPLDRMRVAAGIAALLVLPGLADAQLKNPSDWTWRLDTDATLVTSLDPAAGSWLFVAMPPGWHITTGPGALLYPAKLPEVDGNFSLESQVFLFPGKSQEEVGLFIAGRLEGAEAQEYTAMLMRRDGHAAAITRARGGEDVLSAWRSAVPAMDPGASEPAKYILRVDADPTTVSFSVNGVKALEFPRSKVPPAGRIGFRIGKDLNLHVTSLDVTRRLAPVPVKK